MPQLSLYLDDATMEEVRRNAEAADVSLSQYVSGVLKKANSSTWPRGFFDLYGSIDDESFSEPAELPFELDAPRDAL